MPKPELKVHTAIRLSPSMLEDLGAIADRKSARLSEVVREALAQYIAMERRKETHK